MNSVEAAIDAAPLHLAPFPHFIADGVLDSGLLRDVCRNWPSRWRMQPEGDGSLDRRWGHLLADDRDVSKRLGRFWRGFTAEIAPILLRSDFARFAPFLPCDSFQTVQLVCFEAGKDFIWHGYHSHYNFAPDWIFTFLLYIDDDWDDRGTRVYSIDGFDPLQDARYFDAVANCTERMRFTAVRDTGFMPGRLFAFLDSPVSYHGSTPFDHPGAKRARKILRAHVRMPPEDGQRRYGADFLSRCTAYRDDGGDHFSEVPGFRADREMVRSGFRVLSATAP